MIWGQRGEIGALKFFTDWYSCLCPGVEGRCLNVGLSGLQCFMGPLKNPVKTTQGTIPWLGQCPSWLSEYKIYLNSCVWWYSSPSLSPRGLCPRRQTAWRLMPLCPLQCPLWLPFLSVCSHLDSFQPTFKFLRREPDVLFCKFLTYQDLRSLTWPQDG